MVGIMHPPRCGCNHWGAKKHRVKPAGKKFTAVRRGVVQWGITYAMQGHGMSDAQPDLPAESTDGTGSLSDDLNELCHEVIQALDAGALVVDSSLRILAANPTLLGWCRQWGWDVDVVGKDVFSVFSFLPDSVRDEFNHVLRTGESVTVERALTIGGHELIFESRKTPIRRDGQVAGVVMIIREITALKQAQRDKDRALARLEEFESIVNRSQVVVFLWRASPADQWPVEFVSDSVRQFGYAPEDFTSGRVSWTSVTYPQDVPRLEAEVAGHIEQGDSTFSQEYRLIDASGTVRWVEDRNLIIRDAEGAMTHIQGIILDITERRQAKIKLRNSEEKYRVLVESAEEAIFAMDAEGTYLFMNATAAAAVGGSPEDFVGKTMWDVFPKGVADRQAQTVRTVI